ncbi:MAG: MFS transporter, partial [Acidobacteria bacterium]|nr:MFS transporter [Acidobacteriota bacterium]
QNGKNCKSSVITYLDRVCISAAAPSIREELHLSLSQMGWVFSAFTFAYAAFEVPAGWLGDLIGPRKVLARIVVWWSAFTVATGFAGKFSSLLVIRFLFGAGEAGAFPNASKAFSRWFPVEERGRAHGILFMGTRIGGALAPPLIVLLIEALGWREAFWIFGALGIVWALFWWTWFRDDPSQHPSVNAAELSHIRQGLSEIDVISHRKPLWNHIFRSRNLFCLCLMYFCLGYGLYFYLTWLPTYFKEARGFSLKSAGLLTGLTLLTGAVANMIGGVWTDRLSRRYG